jgi:hypothetical protein
MRDQRVCLKIKIKSLAAEAKIIRQEERKNRGDRGAPKRQLLKDHRQGIVRNEQRHTLLAYGFIRGRALEQIEDQRKSDPDWGKVWKMIEKYGVCRDWRNYEDPQEFSQRSAEQKLAFANWKK